MVARRRLSASIPREARSEPTDGCEVGTSVARTDSRIHDKNVIIICDCIDCENKPSWVQGFFTRKGLVKVDLCENHHFILRTKVPGNIVLDEDVLKWLLIQDSNPYNVEDYGTIKNMADLQFLKELDKIEIELE